MGIFDVQVGEYLCTSILLTSYGKDDLLTAEWRVDGLLETSGVGTYTYVVTAHRYGSTFEFYLDKRSDNDETIFFFGYNVQSLDPVEGIRATLTCYLDELRWSAYDALKHLNKE